MKTLEDVLRQLKNDAEAFEAMARGHRAGSVAAARFQGDATGIRHAVAEIETEIERRKNQTVEVTGEGPHHQP